MVTPAANSAPPFSAAGVPSSGPSVEYSTEVPWRDNGYSDSPVQAYANGPSEDPDRLDLRTRVDSRPNLANPLGWWRRKSADQDKRESVVSRNAIGWEKTPSRTNERAPDPRWTPVPESRPTQQMNPNTYTFERPFDATMERSFNGVHFSMADHRRTYDIYGMTPVSHARNTYRIEPGPTDRDITDMPTDSMYSEQRAAVYDVPVSAVERSWRI